MRIAILLFNRFTVLDAIGPYQVLSALPGAEAIFVAERPGPIADEKGSVILSAPAALADVPHPEIVLVPGGPGQNDQMHDGPLHDWLRAADETSAWTTSVCTGSLILAAAGLLTGRETSHWLALDELARFGAKPVSRAGGLRRQVRDCGGRVLRHRHGAGPGRPDRGRRGGPGHPARHRVRPAAALRRRLPGPRPGRPGTRLRPAAASS